MLGRILRGAARGSGALALALTGGVVASTTAMAPAPAERAAAPDQDTATAPASTPPAPMPGFVAPVPTATATRSLPPALAQSAGIVPDRAGTPVEASSFRTDRTSVLYLVNKRWGVQRSYVPSGLTPIPGGQRLRSDAAVAWRSLLGAAQRDGVQLTVVSAYRSYDYQGQVSANLHGSIGRQADRLSAPPGHSEHQLGLALDVVGEDGRCKLQACFGQTPEGQWLAAHATEHGFVIRYPFGQESRTGYQPEPWHLRYLGGAVVEDMAARHSATYEDWVLSYLPGAPVS